MIFQMKTAPCPSSAKTSFAGVVVDPAGSQTDIKHGKASHTAVQSSVLEEVGVLAFALCMPLADLLNRRSLGDLTWRRTWIVALRPLLKAQGSPNLK